MRLSMLRAVLVATFAIGNFAPLLAHGNAKPMASRHGGQVAEDANHHAIELVVDGASLVFHVREHDEPLDLTGSSFKAVVQTDAGTTTLPLSIEGTALKAALGAPLPAGAKIVLTGKDGHGDPIQARFATK